MNKFTITLAAATLLGAPAFAAGHAATGDAAAGEAVFSQCQTCHVIADDAGNVLAGRNARQGPNLYAIPGRTAGSNEEFASGRPGYRDSIVAAGEAGLVWTEETFVAYVQDPQGFLREYLDDPRARSGMAYRVRSADDALNLYAYIASLAPES